MGGREKIFSGNMFHAQLASCQVLDRLLEYVLRYRYDTGYHTHLAALGLDYQGSVKFGSRVQVNYWLCRIGPGMYVSSLVLYHTVLLENNERYSSTPHATHNTNFFRNSL